MIETAAPTKRSHNEDLKEGNPLLGGTIAQTLADPTKDSFTHDDYEFLKFHGVYQQDDRDQRKVAKHYMLMVRTKFPGGALSAAQYLACDQLASQYGNQTLRVTTRQDFQFHGVLKTNLRQTIHELNRVLITTIAACGDVERNITAPPAPVSSPLAEQVLTEARRLSRALTPVTTAYHQIWIEGKELDLRPEEHPTFVDPLYGKQYLPRKFKTGFAIPPRNDVEILTNDLGYIVIAEGDRLVGYNLAAGGGLGMSHGNPQTFPRLADVIGFLTPEHLERATKAVIGIHRDYGDRANRKHARLKYIIAERGVDWFRGEVERRANVKLAPARPFEFTQHGDTLGWQRQTNGNWYLGLFVQNGRIQDSEGYRLRSGLRAVVERHQPEVRLTPSQNVLLVNVSGADREAVTRCLAEHGVSVENPFSPTRLASMACPSLPTCGLGLAESERFLPTLLTRFEALLEEVGLAGEEFILRMTGCPNGCARPSTAEIAFVGKAPGRYQICLGGNVASTRLNRVFRDGVKETDLIAELRPVLVRFRQERGPGERFGDWCRRTLWEQMAPIGN